MFQIHFTGSPTSIELRGRKIPGAEDRQQKISGFDQKIYSQSHVLCIGAGGLISNIAPALVRKGIGGLIILDPDVVELSNLNRQRFYRRDLGKNKAIAFAKNLQRECIHDTKLVGHSVSLETAMERKINLDCDLAICGIDNNPGRVAASRFFRDKGVSIIFVAVSEKADHGYCFIQRPTGACIGCLFPDIADDQTYPCPGTPAISDVLQLVGALAVYAVDAVLMNRDCDWNYRSEYLPGRSMSMRVQSVSRSCELVAHH
ncbi:MAG TPA: ThiF family adenylyltransferase [Candidatus Angelobacter sp.]|nr:ThiF family adenylyltransferase [Candidatus Angelobacter sp.]